LQTHGDPPRFEETPENSQYTAAYGNATRKLPDDPEQLAKSLLFVVVTIFFIQQFGKAVFRFLFD
jgi:hypothetical protein